MTGTAFVEFSVELDDDEVFVRASFEFDPGSPARGYPHCPEPAEGPSVVDFDLEILSDTGWVTASDELSDKIVEAFGGEGRFCEMLLFAGDAQLWDA